MRYQYEGYGVVISGKNDKSVAKENKTEIFEMAPSTCGLGNHKPNPYVEIVYPWTP
jgi:hypothetical protein